MSVVVITLDRRFFDRAVHPLDLAIGPRMVDLGQAMSDAIVFAEAIEDMFESKTVAFAMGELNPVIGQEGMDLVGHRHNQLAQKLCGIDLAGAPVQFDISEF